MYVIRKIKGKMDENKKVQEAERKDEKNGTHCNEEDKKINFMFCHIRACIKRLGVTFPLGSRDFCLLQNVQTGSRAHTACYSAGQFSESTSARE